jgi:hypothetical protein
VHNQRGVRKVFCIFFERSEYQGVRAR